MEYTRLQLKKVSKSSGGWEVHVPNILYIIYIFRYAVHILPRHCIYNVYMQHPYCMCTVDVLYIHYMYVHCVYAASLHIYNRYIQVTSILYKHRRYRYHMQTGIAMHYPMYCMSHIIMPFVVRWYILCTIHYTILYNTEPNNSWSCLFSRKTYESKAQISTHWPFYMRLIVACCI